MPMRVRIIGSGEAFDTERGNQSCLLLGSGLPTVLFDCGYQIPERLWRLDAVYPDIDAIWLSARHAEHTFGLVPLIARYAEEERIRPLHILGGEGTENHVRQLLELGYPGIFDRLPFEIDFHELDPKIGLAHVGGLTFRCARTNSTVENLSVRVTNAAGRTVGISGDGEMSDETAELFADVDLLLHEVYTPQPRGRHIHMNLESMKAYADSKGKGIHRIGVTHVSSRHHEEMSRLIRELATHDPRWFMAEPDTEIEIRRGVVMRLVG